MATKIVTGLVRFQFPALFEPAAPLSGVGDPKYSIGILIPKTDTATKAAIDAAMQEARNSYCAKNGPNAIPQHFSHTLHDGDGYRPNGDPFPPEAKGHWVMTCNSKKPPLVLDAHRQPIIDPNEVYSGCYGRVSINAYGYNTAGKRGVSFGLLAVQKLKDGTPFGVSASADDFNDGFGDSFATNDDYCPFE